MELQLPYGNEKRTVRIPPDALVEYIAPSPPPEIGDVETAFQDACAHGVGDVSIADISPGSKVIILVSDLTRGKGAETLLPMCVDYLRGQGVAPTNISVLIARGTHRKMTREEREFLQSGPLRDISIEEHDCDDSQSLSALMLTSRGTPVRINSLLKTADATILLSPISFHYFAGFGGGRKLVLPGCAARDSILANHKLSLRDEKPVRLDTDCRPGWTAGNPVHEDMCETLNALHGVVGINFYSNDNGNLVFLNSGHPLQAHEQACLSYRSHHEHIVTEPYSVLILSSGGSPYDMNFLQSHKALRHCAGALAEGATVLFYAECGEGIGSASLEAAMQRDADEFLKDAVKVYDLNNQTAVSLYDLTQQYDVGMVSSVNVDTLLACGIKPCVNAESFLAEALERHETRRIGVVKNGSSVLPHAR